MIVVLKCSPSEFAGFREAIMKHEAIIGIALSALALFGNLGIAHAQADCKT